MAEQPAAEPRRILEPDAAAAVLARRFGEQLALADCRGDRRPDSLGNMNFIRPMNCAARQLADQHFDLAVGDRLPVDRLGIDDRGFSSQSDSTW